MTKRDEPRFKGFALNRAIAFCLHQLEALVWGKTGLKLTTTRVSKATWETDFSARLDLTVASRVHMLEPQWSPMAEEQALDRVHRIGQCREVVVTRYIVSNSIEEVSASNAFFSYFSPVERSKLYHYTQYVVAIQGIKSRIVDNSVEGNDSAKPMDAKERFMKVSVMGLPNLTRCMLIWILFFFQYLQQC